ncbi:MAG: zinc-ribbon domain-containing protein [Chloroflexota bacterium]
MAHPNRETAQKNMLYGALWCIGGIVVTAASYDAAQPGGTYIIAWGAILFGGLQFLAGVVQYLTSPTQPGLSSGPQVVAEPERDTAAPESQLFLEPVEPAGATVQEPEPVGQPLPDQPQAGEVVSQAVAQEPEPVEEEIAVPAQPVLLEERQTCPHCGHSNPAGSRYCMACGASLVASEATPATPELKKIASSPARLSAPPFSCLLLVVTLAGVLLLIGLGIAGFWGYRFLGQREFGAGLAAYEAVDCRAAMVHFNRVSGFYRWSLNPDVATAKTRSDECGLLLFAEDNRAQGNFANAVSGYETYLRQYPEAALGPQARTAVTETYQQWAAQLRADGQFEAAIEKYRLLLDKYPDTPAGQEAVTLVAEVYLAWGQYLYTQQKYDEAMGKFSQVQQVTDKVDLLAAAQQGYQEALQALSTASTTTPVVNPAQIPAPPIVTPTETPVVMASTTAAVVSLALTPASPTVTPTKTPPSVMASAAAPTPIPLESDVSIAQIGEREVSDVDINPFDPQEVYVLVKGDGIYKSSNGGDGPWARLKVDGSAITAFVIDPTDPATLYAPTWNGVLKSTDGGNIWAVKTGGLGIPNRSVDVLTVHPTSPNLVYVGIGQTLIVSSNGGENWSTPADAYGVGLGVSRFYQIVIDPFKPDIIYVGGAAGEIYKSVDAGRNFTRLNFSVGEGAFSLVAHPTQKDVYLAGINAYDAGIIKIENGTDFRSVSIGLVFGGADSAYSAITYAPSDPTIVYAGSGYEDNRVAKGIFKSTNGGESWTSINNGLKINGITGFPHYVKSIAVHPTQPDIVFAATGSGLYKSVDGGASWSLR